MGAIDPQAGMDEMSARFKEMGNALYLDADKVAASGLAPELQKHKAANKALG